MNELWAVFLDRDGTLNEHVGLLTRPDELSLIPGVAGALTGLQAAGALLIVVTNQPVVARELVSEPELAAIHARLQELLAVEGVRLDDVFYCPHHPETHHPEAANPLYRRECDCRKPKPGLVLAAAMKFDLDLKACFLVGDSTRDVGAARAAGCRSVLLKTGVGGADGACPDDMPDYVAETMAEAAGWILEQKYTAHR